jgi:hypothetical protein
MEDIVSGKKIRNIEQEIMEWHEAEMRALAEDLKSQTRVLAEIANPFGTGTAKVYGIDGNDVDRCLEARLKGGSNE